MIHNIAVKNIFRYFKRGLAMKTYLKSYENIFNIRIVLFLSILYLNNYVTAV